MANPFDGSSGGSGGGFGSPWSGMGGSSNDWMSGLAGLFGGMFGNSGGPYGDAMKQYQQWAQRGIGAQNPFYNAGIGGMQDYQKWLQGMQDPSKFINNLMGKYQASPYSQFLQQQSMRAGQNMGSADGTMGSSPMAQQLQQNAGNIASGDMNQWLQNVIGVNTQYGQGEANLMGVGQHAADQMSGMYGNMANAMGQGAYGQAAGQNQDFWNEIGGAAKIGSMFL